MLVFAERRHRGAPFVLRLDLGARLVLRGRFVVDENVLVDLLDVKTLLT